MSYHLFSLPVVRAYHDRELDLQYSYPSFHVMDVVLAVFLQGVTYSTRITIHHSKHDSSKA